MIDKYLESLIRDKDTLFTNMSNVGVQGISQNDTFTELLNNFDKIIEGDDMGPVGYITFIDYDGTTVTTWTKEQLEQATELPTNPTHEGLVADGWNWTLEELKAEGNAVVVGQTYNTDDGSSRMYLDWREEDLHKPFKFRVYNVKNNNFKVDWGDGTVTEQPSTDQPSHIYTTPGKYVIKLFILEPNQGWWIDGNGSMCYMGSYNIMGTDYKSQDYETLKRITKIELHSSTRLGRNMFSHSGARTITIPKGISGYVQAQYMYSLQAIVCPKGLNITGNLDSDASYYKPSIKRISVAKDSLENIVYLDRDDNIVYSGTTAENIIAGLGNYAPVKQIKLALPTYKHHISDIKYDISLRNTSSPISYLEIPDDVEIVQSASLGANLKTVVFPKYLKSLPNDNNNRFYSMTPELLDFSKCIQVPELSSQMYNGLTNYNFPWYYLDPKPVIKVPHLLYADWIADNKWKNIKDAIYPDAIIDDVEMINATRITNASDSSYSINYTLEDSSQEPTISIVSSDTNVATIINIAKTDNKITFGIHPVSTGMFTLTIQLNEITKTKEMEIANSTENPSYTVTLSDGDVDYTENEGTYTFSYPTQYTHGQSGFGMACITFKGNGKHVYMDTVGDKLAWNRGNCIISRIDCYLKPVARFTSNVNINFYPGMKQGMANGSATVDFGITDFEEHTIYILYEAKYTTSDNDKTTASFGLRFE